MRTKQNYFYVFLIGIVVQFFALNSIAQTHLPECTSGAPLFIADLSANPTDSYTTPEFIRQAGCCGDNDRFVTFYVTLHPDVAMFELVVAPGYADPIGSGNYQIVSGGDLTNPGTCGPLIPAGGPICITGPGPHKILYSKPGGNAVKYIFKQIPKPIYPASQPTRLGCSLPLPIYGLNNITVNAISKSANCAASLSTCNTYLSCTNCETPVFQGGANPTYPYTITYQVTGIPKAAACGSYSTSGTFTVTVYDALNITATPNPAAFCAGGGGVTLTANATGGDGNYTYNWRNSVGTIVSNSSTYLATTEETFTAEVVDGLTTSTCPADYVSVPVRIGSLPIVNAGLDQVVCASSPAVFLNGTSSTGTGVWSGGAGTFSPSATALLTTYTPTAGEISSGSVTLTFTSTDAGSGCANTSDQVLVTISPLVNATPSALPIVCSGGTTTIDANPSGGTPGYTYFWSTGATTSSITASAGTYEVQVSDIYGCKDLTPITIVNPTPVLLSMSSTNTSTDIACDGNASVAVSGGMAPYSVLWSNGETTLTTTSTLCYGVYTVTVTDASGCVNVGSVVVNKPSCSLFNVTTTSSDVDCYGQATGTAQSFPVGGAGGYIYNWNSTPAQTTQNAIGLPAGTYTVTVTDALGCVDVASAVVLQPTIITNTMTHTDVTTIGGSDGTATANPLGGSPGYSYVWTPGGQTTQTATNLSSAVGGVVYYVDITDNNSCLKEDSILINQPPCNDFTLGTNLTHVTCNGLSNGAASLVIANGTPSYSIVWSSGELNVMSVSGLNAGNYTVTVTDASNCTTFETFTITEPTQLSIGLVPTNITCYNDGNGTIDLTVSGGTFPFTYTWMQGSKIIATHEDLTNLEPGTYSVTVVDANGCSTSGSVGITQPAQLKPINSYVNVNCFGESNGSIDATPVGGTTPYTYGWSGPGSFSANTQDISGLEFGLYTLHLTDGNACTYDLEVYISQPDLLVATPVMLTQVTCAGGLDGSIDLSVSGGTTSYGYAWTGPLGYTSIVEDPSGLVAGTYNITVTDAHSCVASASVNVTTVLDVTNPIITCTGNQAVNTSLAACSYTVSGTAWNATATDNCLVSSVLATLSGATTASGLTTLNGVAFNLGTTTVSWTATDGLGNTATCSYDVVVTDNVFPSISSCGAAGNQTVNVDAAQCNFTQTGSAWDATATDNCTVSTIVATLSGATTASGLTTLAGVDFNLGTTTVLWTVTDGVGNISTCTFNVTVVDNILPSITSCGAAGNQTVNVDAAQCNFTQTGTAWNATATDNCTVSTIVASLSGATSASGLTTLAGVDFNLGVTTVLWTVTDGSGNISTCTFNVTVVDNILPSITSCGAAGNQTVNVDAAQCNFTQTGTAWNATATDNCTVSTIVATLSGATTASGLTTLAGVDFNLGVTTVLWSVTDGSGNTSTCTFTVTVVDNILPAITSCGAAGNQTVNVDAAQCNFTQTGTAWNATATDNCTVSTIVATLSGATTASGLTTLAGVDFNLGTTTVLWTVTDGSGNTSTCTFDVTVVDNILPAITSCGAAGNQTVNVDAAQCNYTQAGNAWNATATDNCTVSTIVATLSGATTASGLTTLAGVDFNLGTTTVLWTVTDGSGNTSTCTFDVTVVDNILPAITSCGAAGNQTVNVDAAQCNFTQTGTAWDATATDNCTVSTIVATLSGATTASGLTTLAGVDFNLGTTTVLWTVTDGSGNTSTCTFNVTVLDNILPSITSCGAAGNQTVNVDAAQCNFTQTGTAWNATATDNCTVSTIVATLSGATTASGLTTLAGVDFNLGTTTVLWTVTDGSGNTSTCTFNVTVVDNILPAITSCGASGNQTVNVDATQCNYTQTGTAWNATATDNCTVSTILATLSGATTASGLTTLAGVDFNIGTTTVLWTVTDGSGNTSTCTFDVTVVDNILPSITSCGAAGNQTVNVDAAQCNYTQAGNAWNATATDNCTVSTIVANLSGATTASGLTTLAGVDFNLGTTTVLWTVTDGSGNTSTCTFDVTVVDNILPSITSCGAAGNQTVNVDAAQCNYTQTGTAWNATATDNCTVSTIVATLSGATTASGLTTLAGVDFNLGTTTVLWTVTDGSGNISTCTFNVTVVDNILPSITSCGAAGNQTVNVDAAQCNFTQTGTAWNATATDNCTVSTIVATLSGATTASGLTTLAGVDFNLGTTTVLWTVTDGSGNISTCTFNVTVLDNILPSITSCGAAGNQTVNVDAAQCNFTQTGTAWNATATDNCTVSTIVATLSGATTASGLATLAGVDFNLGTTTVLWTVTDGSGNTSTCTFDVTVVDNIDPTILSCGATGAQVVSSDLGVCTFTQTANSWDAIASDNCTVGSISYTLSGATTGSGTSLAGVTFNSGITTVLWTVVDGSSNTSTCSFTVEVEDNQAPIISGCPSNITVGTDNGDCGAIVTWSVPTFTDNCGAVISSNNDSGDFFATGTTTVIYTVTDGAGNISICSFTVTVNDDELPSLTCPTPISSCDPFVVYPAPTYSDNCGILSTLQTAGLPSGVNFPVGTIVNAYQTTDIHGNVSTCTFSVTIFSLPVASTDVTDVSCFGLNNGEIDLTITSGTAPYGYSWSNMQSSEDLIGLAPGTYSVSVTDDNGCSTTASASVAQPELLELSAEDNPVNCFNGSDGSIDITVTGGISPYTYTWSNGATSEDVSGLSAGDYDVLVTDFNGCEITYMTTISEPDSLMISATVFNANCGSATGTISVQVTGGNAPYEFDWSNGTTEMSLYNVVAGTYTFVVTDAENCSNTFTGTITSTSTLDASLVIKDAKCYGQNSGTIQAIVTSGYAPFTYDWSDGQLSPTATDLLAGSYSVTVTDMFGCQVTLNGTVDQPDSLYAIVTSSLYVGGYNVSTNNGSDGYLNTQVFGGTAPYSFDWTGPSNFTSTNQNLVNLEAGAYALILTDDNGCTFSTSTRLVEPTVLEMPNGYSPNGDGDNETFVVHGIDAYPNNEIVVFNRWGNIVYKKANYANEWAGDNTVGEALPDGTYFVILIVVAGEEEITLKGYVDLRR